MTGTAWVLVFFLFGQVHTVSGIASKPECHDLAARISADYSGVDAANVKAGKCYSYAVRW